MKDTHEANLPTEENGKLEETKAPETTPENTAEEVVTNETTDAEVAAEETSEAEVKTDEVAAGVKKPLRLRENCRKKKFWRN